mgnify:CR=1 FL=1
MADLFKIHSDLLRSFVEIVRACYEVKLNEGFMRDLMETNRLLLDFILNLGYMYVKPNRIIIDSKFLRFIKLYEKDILNDIVVANGYQNVDQIIQKMEQYIKIIKNKVKPSFNKSIIHRYTRRELKSSLEKLIKLHKQVKISKEISENLKKYVPSRILQIIVLIEESGILESTKTEKSK